MYKQWLHAVLIHYFLSFIHWKLTTVISFFFIEKTRITFDVAQLTKLVERRNRKSKQRFEWKFKSEFISI